MTRNKILQPGWNICEIEKKNQPFLFYSNVIIVYHIYPSIKLFKEMTEIFVWDYKKCIQNFESQESSKHALLYGMYMYYNPMKQTENTEMKPNENTEMKTAEMSKTHQHHNNNKVYLNCKLP